MPGFTIHIAIAKRYTEKHINEIKNIICKIKKIANSSCYKKM